MVVVQILRTAGIVLGILLLNEFLARSGARYGPYPDAGLAVALVVSEVGLCSVWAIIGRDHWLARLFVFLMMSIRVWAFLLGWNRMAQDELLPGCVVQAFIVMSSLMVMRAMGYRLVRGEMATAQDSSRSIPRFSIRDLMIFMMLVGFVGTAVIRLGALKIARDAPAISAAVGVFLAVITFSSVLSTLVFHQSMLPALFTGAASILLGWGIGAALRYDPVITTIAIGMPSVLQLAVLLLWRQTGDRFARDASCRRFISKIAERFWRPGDAQRIEDGQ